MTCHCIMYMFNIMMYYTDQIYKCNYVKIRYLYILISHKLLVTVYDDVNPISLLWLLGTHKIALYSAW